jgi:hypothetical protein
MGVGEEMNNFSPLARRQCEREAEDQKKSMSLESFARSKKLREEIYQKGLYARLHSNVC